MELKNNRFLPLNLQFFADPDPEPTPDPEPIPDPEPTPDPEPIPDPEPSKEKTYSQEEMEEIIKQRVAREKKAAEKAVQEAEKLAKMNEEQKRQYEFEKLQKELEDYKKKDAYNTMSKEASKMLVEHEIVADEKVLSFVVKETADETKDMVNAFVDLIKEKVQDGVKKALAGTSPKKNNTTPGTATSKEEIMKEKDSIKRQKLIQENIHLFK
ncbi:phage capsid protein [Oceanobacillus arenosus]|uniref:Phage capsid protein n=1 Tax=Oceanobacillus arenosus TaxID=1229153 RepID=A0A3D8PP76_9BACI|nr:DUF4355 domain-containing protein [Oceanobacillus arenosus]RDW17041.1 phage capsid protein [Oceanobacillus arenosus]